MHVRALAAFPQVQEEVLEMSIIDDFISESKLDERASDALKSCRPEVQMAVLERGSLSDARNPSSAVLGRIRDAEKDAGKGARRGSGPAPQASEMELEAFLLENVVDERAAEAIRSASAEVQHAAIQRGSLQDAKNPSSALLGRLRDAEGSLGGSSGGKGRQSGRDSGQMEALVEAFISVGGLDDRAAEAMRKAPPMAQKAVMDGGPVSECRNPSSAVIGRLKDAKENSSSMSSAPMMGMKGMGKGYDAYGGWGGDGGFGGFGPCMGGYGGGYDAYGGSPYMMGGFGGGKGGGMCGKSQAPKRQRPASGTVETDAEVFIESNGLDERAAEAFRTCGAEVQQAVMERGDLKDARNPSSAVLGRMKDAKAEVGAGGGSWGGAGAGGAAPEEVEEFITSSGLDERAADAFRGCNPDVQRIVLDRGGLEDARNPSSAVLGRIKDAQSLCSQGGFGGGGGGGGWATSPSPGLLNVESFLKENGIDERACDALQACSPAVQQAVLMRGGVKDCRNPSSALLGRIKDAQGDSGKGGMKGDGGMKGGKGKGGGGGIFDMVMGMLSGGGGGCWGGDSWGNGGGKKGGKKGGRDVQDFLRNNNVDESAANAFIGAGPEVQYAVMERGDLSGARNPSSALLGRIKDAAGGKGGGKGGKKGKGGYSPY